MFTRYLGTLVILLFAISSEGQNTTTIISRLDIFETESYTCNDISGDSDNSCIYYYKGKRFKKIEKVLLKSNGLIDSVYWYGNPLGVYPMGVKEYFGTFKNLSGNDCLSRSIYLDNINDKLIDGCDTLDFGGLSNVQGDVIEIERSKYISLYFISK